MVGAKIVGGEVEGRKFFIRGDEEVAFGEIRVGGGDNAEKFYHICKYADVVVGVLCM